MGASRSQGPPTPIAIPGSELQARLEREGADTTKGLEIIKHIIRRRTPGYVNQVVWNKESSLLQHEYLLICIAFEDSSELSWVRLERMGAIGKRRDTDRKRTELLFTVAPFKDALVNPRDETVHDAMFGLPRLGLVDTAHLISIVHETAPDYTLLHDNCWWFARKLMSIFVQNFQPDGKHKRTILNNCTWRAMEQAEAPYHAPWRGRLVRGVLLVATIPVFFIAWPIIIGTTAGIAIYSSHQLGKTEKGIDDGVKKYLESR